jgi:hypothetical protein
MFPALDVAEPVARVAMQLSWPVPDVMALAAGALVLALGVVALA